jgi:hypothetical protein
VQRELQAAQSRAAVLQNSFQTYAGRPTGVDMAETGQPGTRPDSDRVVPQLSDSFIDRMVQLLSASSDLAYRQQMVQRIIDSSFEEVVPLEKEVQYYTDVVNALPSGGAGTSSEGAIAPKVESVYGKIVRATDLLRTLHEQLSKNLLPESELVTWTGPPVAQTERGISLAKLLLVGFLVLLVSFPVILAACLIHYRLNLADDEIQALPAPQSDGSVSLPRNPAAGES